MRESKRAERGTSLIETLIATAICTTVMFGMAGMMVTAMKQNKNQGATVAQCTTLSAQKLDQLLEIPWSGTAPATLTASPSVTCPSGLTPPCTTLDVETSNYVDYLDKTGGTTVTSTSADKFFIRRWLIEDITGGTSKKITVRVLGKSVGSASDSSSPQATLACFKVQQ